MEIKEKVLKVTELFGMKDDVVALAMGLTVATVRKNKSEKALTNNFNQKNYEDLVRYIKETAEKLEL